MSARSLSKCCGFIILSASVISPSVVKIGPVLRNLKSKIRYGEWSGKVIRNPRPGADHQQNFFELISLFPFPFFSHINIPIFSHSQSRLCGTIDGNSYSTVLHKSQRCCLSNTNSRHTVFNTNYTIHHCVTEDRHKSRCGPLCESQKQTAQSVV